MDLFELFLLIVFFLIPLLQGLFSKKRPPENPELPGEWEEGEPWLEQEGEGSASAEQRTRMRRVEDVIGGWSEGWGEWPTEPEEAEEREEKAPVVVAESDAGVPIIVREAPTEAESHTPIEEEAPPRPLPEQHPPPPLVVSLEPTHIDRGAEHQRFHDRYVARRQPPEEIERIPRAPRQSSLLAYSLSDVHDVRRAIVLAEILGPPRALQPLEPEV